MIWARRKARRIARHRCAREHKFKHYSIFGSVLYILLRPLKILPGNAGEYCSESGFDAIFRFRVFRPLRGKQNTVKSQPAARRRDADNHWEKIAREKIARQKITWIDLWRLHALYFYASRRGA